MCKSVRLYILVGLLLVLSSAMRGQTIKRFEGNGWFEALTKGTVLRNGNNYMMFDEGIGNIVTFDFVNNYNFGPDMTFGHVAKNYSRWEIRPELRYSDRRHVWNGSLELRYTLPPEYFSWIELFGRRKCVDFDNYPYTSYANNSMASTIAGWNGYKLYDAQQIGAKFSTALSSDFQVEGGAWHEKRWQMENHRLRNIFRVTGEDNTPRLRGVSEDDPMHQWGRMTLWRVDAALEYTPNRRIMCYNDLRTEVLPGEPVFRLSAQSGWGDYDYLSLSLSVKQEIGNQRQAVRYMVGTGYYPLGKEEVRVMDMHHFDASHMALQRKDNLTWFSLLSNYELSSSNAWAEAHAEWNSCKMLLTQWTNDPSLKEYLQLHFASVEGYRQHTELSYGIDLASQIRIGCSFGFDGSSFDGIGLNIVFYSPVLGQ